MKKTAWIQNGMRMALAAAALTSIAGTASAADKVQVVVFGPPSLGAFLPPVIKAQKLDEANGLDIDFVQRPPDAYATQFNSGEFKVGGSAALLTVGLASTKGVKVSYLFNLFDYWAAVVTRKPEIKTITDLAGKSLAAARGTTSYAMFEWLASRQGLDTSKISAINTTTPGLIGYALANRADAVQLWEPAYSTLKLKAPDIHLIDLNIKKEWTKFAGSPDLPYLGVAAHQDWIQQNPKLVDGLYKSYKAAADWITAHPKEAAAIIVPKDEDGQQGVIADLIVQKERLGMNVKWASDQRKEIEAVYKAGVESGRLKEMPETATIYQAPKR
ncbi:ABC transporter substrate-binding protein [Ferrovibrio xuzhouensis]|uniref:ABC transporter substrate-binding protein n=1 Tax=Ferrovibrio xuzhouensis TaxID=1576914 RepID=A0ABV7VE41_9PROT